MQEDIQQVLDSLAAHAFQIIDGKIHLKEEGYHLAQEVGSFIFEMFGAKAFVMVFTYLRDSYGVTDDLELRNFWTKVIHIRHQMSPVETNQQT